MKVSVENNPTHQEPKRFQIEWRKATNKCQYVDDRVVRITWQNFKESVIKCKHFIL